MSLHRRAAKRDANEREIIDALEAAGCSVVQLSKKGVPDLLVGYVDTNGIHANVLMEIKDGKAKLTPDEKAFFEDWQGAAYVVRDIDTALWLVGKLNKEMK